MRRLIQTISFLALAQILGFSAAAQRKALHISVVDLQDRPVELVQLTTTGKSSTGLTDSDGKVAIILATDMPLNTEVELRITGAPKDLVFISPWDKRVPMTRAVKIVLAERGIRQLLEDPRALGFGFHDHPGRSAKFKCCCVTRAAA